MSLNSKVCLYLVATPIGNLGDITQRALEVLSGVDVIAAEDTRHSGPLLKRYNIATHMIALHDFNEAKCSDKIVAYLKEGKAVALISDAGSPLISDPGYHLVQKVTAEGFDVVSIPGPCALVAALIASGLPTDRFTFAGFLPAKGVVRQKKLQQLVDDTGTIVLYESVHRIINLLELIQKLCGPERYVVVARELTKTYETFYRDTVVNVLTYLQEHTDQIKGEFVVLIKGAIKSDDQKSKESERFLRLLLPGLSVSKAVAIVAEISGGKRKELYSQALLIKQELESE